MKIGYWLLMQIEVYRFLEKFPYKIPLKFLMRLFLLQIAIIGVAVMVR